MDQEQRLESEIKEYMDVAKTNKNVDVGALMMYSLQNENKNLVSSKAKKWAYFISISLPPLGALVALNYYMKDEDDAKHVANMCVILTVISVILLIFFSKMLFSTAGTSVSQISQIKPSDVFQLTQ